jgi:hypothetical protein
LPMPLLTPVTIVAGFSISASVSTIAPRLAHGGATFRHHVSRARRDVSSCELPQEPEKRSPPAKKGVSFTGSVASRNGLGAEDS